MIASILTTIFFAFSAVCSKRTAEIFGSLSGNFWRLVIAALSLGAITWLLYPNSIATAPFLWFLYSGAIGFGIGDIGLFLAFSRLGSRLTMLINLCLAPLFAALGEFLWMGTRITAAEVAAATAIIIGVGFALLPRPGEVRPRRDYLPGILLAVLAGFGQGIGAVISRRAEEIALVSNLDITGVSAAFQRIIGGLAVALLAYLIATYIRKKNRPSRPRDRHSKHVAANWLLGAALLGPVIGTSCFQSALKTTPSALVLAIVATTPIVLIPITFVIENDLPTRKSLLGALLAVIGVVAICFLRTG